MKCHWHLGTECFGNINEEKIFHNQITVPICEKHLDQHKKIMFLHSCGVELEYLMNSIHEIENLFDKYRAENPDKEIKQ